MKRLNKGRDKTLAGKRKSVKKAPGAKPNARRQRVIALRKKTQLDNLRKRQKTLAKREQTAEEAASARSEES